METSTVRSTYITIKQAAEYTTLSRQYLGVLVRKGEVPCARVGRRIVFKIDALDAWLASRQNPAAK